LTDTAALSDFFFFRGSVYIFL